MKGDWTGVPESKILMKWQCEFVEFKKNCLFVLLHTFHFSTFNGAAINDLTIACWALQFEAKLIVEFKYYNFSTFLQVSLHFQHLLGCSVWSIVQAQDKPKQQ